MISFSFLQKYNSQKKVEKIAAYFSDKKETVLDFGCGDLSFAHSLKYKKPLLQISGVDVVDFKNRDNDIKFFHYNGKKLPFKDNSYDTIISFHVLHHTYDAKKYFKELVRVAKKRILLVESVARTSFEFPGMRFMDWIFNVWKSEKVPMTYQFFTKKEWEKQFRKYSLTVIVEEDVEITFIPKFFPTGRSTLFELMKK